MALRVPSAPSSFQGTHPALFHPFSRPSMLPRNIVKENGDRSKQRPFVLSQEKQAKMQLKEIPLASPLPTTAPHPRDVSRKLLLARQGAAQACGWIDSDFSMSTCWPKDRALFADNFINLASSLTCPLDYHCAKNTPLAAAFCCHSSTFPDCVVPTACVDSTYVAASCGSICVPNQSIVSW